MAATIHRSRFPNQSPFKLSDLTARAEQDAAAAAVDLIGMVWCNPREAMPVAEAEGVTRRDFADTDLLLLWTCCDAARRYCDNDRRHLARRSLQAHFDWDETATRAQFGTCSQWSDATLDALADGWFFSPSIIREGANRLLQINARLREARRLFLAATGILSGEREPESTAVLAPRRSRPLVIFNRSTARGRA